eukprot:Lankesteria_metandrocarpae@DN1255_c0_g1_i2.p1
MCSLACVVVTVIIVFYLQCNVAIDRPDTEFYLESILPDELLTDLGVVTTSIKGNGTKEGALLSRPTTATNPAKPKKFYPPLRKNNIIEEAMIAAGIEHTKTNHKNSKSSRLANISRLSSKLVLKDCSRFSYGTKMSGPTTVSLQNAQL